MLQVPPGSQHFHINKKYSNLHSMIPNALLCIIVLYLMAPSGIWTNVAEKQPSQSLASLISTSDRSTITGTDYHTWIHHWQNLWHWHPSRNNNFCNVHSNFNLQIKLCYSYDPISKITWLINHSYNPMMLRNIRLYIRFIKGEEGKHTLICEVCPTPYQNFGANIPMKIIK